MREISGPAELDGESDAGLKESPESSRRKARVSSEFPKSRGQPRPKQDGWTPGARQLSWCECSERTSSSVAQRKGWKLNSPAKSPLAWRQSSSGVPSSVSGNWLPARWNHSKVQESRL